jgi:hypothetical protein
MVAERSVVMTRSHAAVLEICAQIRTDTGLSVLASRIAPCQSEPLGKPRLTPVSDGNPLRRLLLRSNKNSVFMAVSPFGWICPSHPEEELHAAILAQGGVLVDECREAGSISIVDIPSPFHSQPGSW